MNTTNDICSNCWNLKIPDCASVPDCCVLFQHIIRDWLTYSNIVYIVPIIVVLIIRQGKLDTSDFTYCLNFLFILISSSFYHNCDTAEGSNPCFGYCVLEFNSLYYVDVMVALLSIYSTVSIGWITSEASESIECYFQRFIYLALPIISIWFITWDYVKLFTAITVGVITLFLRIIRGKLNFINTTVLYVRIYPFLLLLAAGFLTGAILTEYSSFTTLPYTQKHSIWHACTMFSSILFVVSIKPNSSIIINKEDTKVKQTNKELKYKTPATEPNQEEFKNLLKESKF